MQAARSDAAHESGHIAPVFLVGAARSGTSLLYKVLCLHSEAGYISNWVRRFPRQPRLAALNRVARRFPDRQASVWFGPDSNAYVYSSPRAWLDRLFPMAVEGEPLFGACGIGSGETRDPRERERQCSALRKAFRSVLAASGGTVLVCKRIANNRRIPLLVEAFPEARFVDLSRDGRAVAFSLSRVDWWEDGPVWWYGGTPRQWREEGGDPWEICARNWVEEVRAIEDGLRAVPPGQLLRITYEDLVANPLQLIRQTAAFAGLPADPAWTQRLEGLRFPNRNDSWRKTLDPDVAARIESIQTEELRRLRYV